MVNAFEFIQQVRAEAMRVVWPTRRETAITTLMVVALAIACSLFLLVVDEALQVMVGLILGFGRHG
jgi:preprotein translocase subunit SecE